MQQTGTAYIYGEGEGEMMGNGRNDVGMDAHMGERKTLDDIGWSIEKRWRRGEGWGDREERRGGGRWVVWW